MTKVDLHRFAKHIERLELANRALSLDADMAKSKHRFRQPIHVMYGGAHLFSEKTFEKIAAMAKQAFDYAAIDHKALKSISNEDWSESFSAEVYSRIQQKLATSPVEDYRVDFEDGYGVRSDDEEDRHAKAAAHTMIAVAGKKYSPSNMGLRIKPLSLASMRRALKTLAIFVDELGELRRRTSVELKHVIVTLPKVTHAEQVATLVEILEGYEKDYHLGHGFFSLELIIESPEAFLGLNGTIPITSFLNAASGRCRSLHFGVYDFTSSLGITSAGQSIDHPACDFARMWIQVAAALVPHIAISDGIISRLPLVPKETSTESRAIFVDAWRYNYNQMMRSLANGYYQGWDLHPCQLPIRHLANHVFVLKEFNGAVERLKAFVAKANQASHVAGMFDDRASVLGLLNFFDRAISSGVVSQSDLKKAGVDLDEARTTL